MFLLARRCPATPRYSVHYAVMARALAHQRHLQHLLFPAPDHPLGALPHGDAVPQAELPGLTHVHKAAREQGRRRVVVDLQDAVQPLVVLPRVDHAAHIWPLVLYLNGFSHERARAREVVDVPLAQQHPRVRVVLPVGVDSPP